MTKRGPKPKVKAAPRAPKRGPARAFSAAPYLATVKALRLGKKLPTARYVHVSVVPQLPPAAADAVRLALSFAGTSLSDVDLIKLGTTEPKVSLLRYPGFWTEPFPALAESASVDLVTGKVSRRVWPQGDTTPILHRKEAFLAAGDPRAQGWAELTADLVARQLFRDTRRIGQRGFWERLLRAAGIDPSRPGDRAGGHRPGPDGPTRAEPALSVEDVPPVPRSAGWLSASHPCGASAKAAYGMAKLVGQDVWCEDIAELVELMEAERSATAFVKDVHVPPDFRGAGIGRALVRRLLAELAARGVRSVYLQSTPYSDDWSIVSHSAMAEFGEAFYEPLGFRFTPTDDRGGPGMVARLDPAPRGRRSAARRPNPPSKTAIWQLWVQLPEPVASWTMVDAFESEEGARDEAISPHLSAPLPLGSLVKIVRDSQLVELRVMSDFGETILAPPLPPKSVSPPGKASNWLEAWEGPLASGPWMLSQCLGIDPRAVARATCECVRPAITYLVPGSSPVVAFEIVDAWAMDGDVRGTNFFRLYDETYNLVLGMNELAAGGDADAASVNAQTSAGFAVADLAYLAAAALAQTMAKPSQDRQSVPDAASDAAREAASAAGKNAERGASPSAIAKRKAAFKAARLAQAVRVREEIPLGYVLLRQLAEPP